MIQGRSTSFGATADVYEAGRPEYPAAAVDWLMTPRKGLRVADVGAGTGKLTRAITAAGHDVVAVDPDPEMLKVLRDKVPGVPTFVGTAESLPLADSSIDVVVLAQAWHWMDPIAGCREIGRVLAPGGALGLIWNLRDVSEPWVEKLGLIVNGGDTLDMFETGAPPIAAPFDSLEEHQWRWFAPMTRAQIVASITSRSHYITSSAETQARFDGQLTDLLNELGLDESSTIDLPYVTVAYRAVRA